MTTSYHAVGILPFKENLKKKLCERIDQFAEQMMKEKNTLNGPDTYSNRQWMEKYKYWSLRNSTEKSLEDLVKEFLISGS